MQQIPIQQSVEVAASSVGFAASFAEAYSCAAKAQRIPQTMPQSPQTMQQQNPQMQQLIPQTTLQHQQMIQQCTTLQQAVVFQRTTEQERLHTLQRAVNATGAHTGSAAGSGAAANAAGTESVRVVKRRRPRLSEAAIARMPQRKVCSHRHVSSALGAIMMAPFEYVLFVCRMVRCLIHKL